MDLRALVAERAGSDPTIGSTDDLLWNVVVTLARRAALGDVPAAKLLLDHLAAAPDAPTAAEHDGLTETERADRIRAILSSVEDRAELDRQRPVLQVETGVPPADDKRER